MFKNEKFSKINKLIIMLSKGAQFLLLIAACISLSCSEIITRKIALRSYRGMYLSATSDGKVKLASAVLDSEKWSLVPFNSEYYLKSFYNNYLLANKDGSLRLVDTPAQWAKWSQYRTIYWKSYHGSYLTGVNSTTVNLSPVADLLQQWTVVDTPDGSKPITSIQDQSVQADLQVILKSFHDTFLRGNSDGTVKLNPGPVDWEKWTLISLGNSVYNFKSFHGTYLSVKKDNSLTLVKEAKDTQRWTKIILDGLIQWKSFYGTYLSAEPSGAVSLKLKAETWEQWIVDPL